jgi:hypothetical protein
VRAAAKGFLSIGAARYDGVAILGFNSPEWFMAEMAAMYMGGKAAGALLGPRPPPPLSLTQRCRIGIYPTDTDEQIKFKSLLSDARCPFPHVSQLLFPCKTCISFPF